MSPDGSPQEQESWNKRFEMSLAEIYMELPDGHRAKKDYEALIAEPRGKIVEMSMRLDELEKTVRDLGIKEPSLCQCEGCKKEMMAKQQPQPAPVPLVEAVEALLKEMPYKIDGCCSFALNDAINNFHRALAAEKRRRVLVDKVIQAARSQLSPDIMDAPCGCPCCEAIAALDAFDKERGA